MNSIWRRMKKCSPSSGQTGQLVHWWLLVHSGLENSVGIRPASCNALQPVDEDTRTMTREMRTSTKGIEYPRVLSVMHPIASCMRLGRIARWPPVLTP